MANEALIKLYGIDDIEKIFEKKTSGRQTKVLGCKPGKKPKRVKLTVEKCRKLCEDVGLDYLEGYESRVIEHTITNETKDRYGDIVKADGVDFKTNYYPNNPTIQYAHDYKMPPIGKTIKIWYDKTSKCVKAWGLYYDNRIDDTGASESIFKFVVSNAMPACSIGFVPKKARRPKNDDERKELGLGEWGVLYESVDLLEYSPCSIGANPDALKNSIEAGEFDLKDCERLVEKKFLPDEIFQDLLKELKPEEKDTLDITEVLESIQKSNKELIESNNQVLKSNEDVLNKLNEVGKSVQELNTTFKPESKDTPPDNASELEQEAEINNVLSILDKEINLGNN